MSKSLVVLFLVITAIVSKAKGDDITYDITGDNTDCNGTVVPVLNNTSGSLKMNLPIDQLKGKTCEWIIDGTGKKDLNINLGIPENLILGGNDVLNITTEDDKKTLLYNTSGFNLPGVILFGDKNNKIRVKLILSNENIDRNWDVKYATNVNAFQIQDIDTIGSFVFPYISNGLDQSKEINFNITLASKIKSKNLLLNVEELDISDGSIAFERVSKYNKSQTFDGKKTDPKIPDFVLSSQNQINIIIKIKISDKLKGLRMHYDLVDSLCSQYQLITALDKTGFTTDVLLPNETSIKSLTSYRCLNIFEHKDPTAKLLIDWRTFEFINTGDLITVLDGNSHDSKGLATVDSQFYDMYWKQLYLYSSTNKLWVMFDSPQVINRNTNSSNTFGVSSLSQGESYVFDSKNNQTKLSLKEKPKTPVPLVFTFTASDFNKQIVIDFDNSKPLPGNGLLMEIYQSTGRDGEPFIKLNSKQTPPDIMASNTNQLKIVFNQTVDFDIDILEVDRGCHSTYLGTSGASYILSGCKPLCSWLIPKRDNSNGTFVLQFSHLDLSKDENIFIEKLELSSKPSSVLNITGQLQTTTFPDLILNSSETYVFYSKRDNCVNTSIDGSQMVGVSLVYVNQNLSFNEEKVDIGETIVLKTASYPNYYSVGSDHLWKIDSANIESKALITFTDIDLSPNHQILLRSSDLTENINSSQKLTDISDNFVKLPLVMNLSSAEVDIAKQPFSGRGFNANLMIVNCGDTLTVTKDKSKQISTPTNLTGIAKCIWTVNTDNPNNKMGLINFTLKGDKDFDKKNLKIWDSNSIRNNNFVNYTIFENVTTDPIYYSSSTNNLIIEYTITDPKKELSLNIALTQQVCGQKCVNTNRCYLPEFQCNGVDDCGDYSDERDCHGSSPSPPGPVPTPIVYHSGVNGWVVTLVLCPLFIGIGVLGTLYGPRLLNRVGRGRYSEFQDFSEVS